MNKVASKDYWQGFNDAKAGADQIMAQQQLKLGRQFMRVLHDVNQIKGVGPKMHSSIVQFAIRQLNQEDEPITVERTRDEFLQDLKSMDWDKLSTDELDTIRRAVEVFTR